MDIKKINEKIQQYPTELWDMLYLPEEDSKILSVFQNNNIKDMEVIQSISNGVKLVAVEIMSKSKFYELIKFRLNDNEDLAKIVFNEFNSKILIPNNFIGLIEDQKEIPNPESSAKTDAPQEIHETAEDILKEIENPTPAPASLPAFTPNPIATTSNITPPPTLYPQQTTTSPESIQTASLTQTHTQNTTSSPQTQTPSPNPTSMIMPTKESILDSKLKEPSAQPLQATYYKVDPYREQTK